MPHPAFEVLEHTADVGIKAYGDTLPQLFSNAARGLVSLALESPPTASAQSLPLSVRGDDYEDLLVNWLSEILFRIDAEGWAFADFTIQRLEAHLVEGIALGEIITDLGQRPRSLVKAVTYHQVSVSQTPQGWQAIVYFDI
ncbi:MAG: hypothetical protein A3F68_10435 [Acidobacteria bacterium RIFCSPLOWO2_12_FULL_54_10]|nr:MAG: hypothetical protein A3F68_10435 [Acidobacteria bacterium RIFCSPLOWO2_12_FULL_54_10]